MPSVAYTEEFKTLTEIQDDRMAHHHNLICHDRCTNSYYAGKQIGPEQTCMENCVWKSLQTNLITNFTYTSFTKHVASGGKL